MILTEAAPPLSGRQVRLSAHGYEAQIASVGASLRRLSYRGRDLILPFDPELPRPGYCGATLAPWPNRIVDGRYRLGDRDHQLPLTEPERGHALHGLVLWSEFAERSSSPDRVVLTAVIEARAGYPFRVEVEVEYRLAVDGLRHTVTGRNLGSGSAPWGTAPHPYLIGGTGPIESWSLHIPAGAVLTTTDRLAPLALGPVEARPSLDFRQPRPIGDTAIDHAYTDLTYTNPSGDSAAAATAPAAPTTRVEVRCPAGLGAAVSWDQRSRWVQIHTMTTGPDHPGADAAAAAAATPTSAPTSASGVAVEPMTCAPDAFNAGSYPFDTGLIRLAPGAARAASWCITAVG